MRFAFFNTKAMNNLIDETYFDIPGLTATSNGTTQSNVTSKRLAKLTRLIAICQKNYLRKMFGKTIAELDALPDEIHALLIDDDLKQSPLANYVYFFWLRDQESVSTMAGEKKTDIASTVSVTTSNKQAYAWNEMVDMNVLIHEDMSELGTIGDYDYITDILDNIDINDSIFEKSHNHGLII